MSQTESGIQKKWIVPIIAVIVLGSVIIFSGGSQAGKAGVETISSPESYNRAANLSRELTESIFERAAANEELTPADKDSLSRAAALYDSMNKFKPDRSGAYFAAGRCYFLLENFDLAEARYRQAIMNTANEPAENEAAAVLTAVESQSQLSEIYLRRGNNEEALKFASLAVGSIPNSPDYLAQRASVYLQIGKNEEAKNDLDAAEKLLPGHRRSASLRKLLGP